MVFAGFYMYIQSSEKGRNDTAQFISKSIVRKNEQCLTFWYHMRGDDIGSLKVYQKQNISMKCIWTKIGPQGKQWIKAYVDLAKYDNYQIVFEGVIKDSNGRSKGETAIDDVYVSDGKCNEDEIINRTCLSVDQENTIEECTTFYLRIDSLDVTLYPSFPNSNNGNECINRENENVMILDNVCRVNYLYSNCKFKLSRIFENDNDCYTFKKKMLITYLCSDMNTTTVSSDSTSKDSSADSSAAVETTTVSSFTTLRRGSSTVSDESVTLSRVMKNSSDSATGLVVGLVIGGLLLACAVIFIVVLFRRHTIKSRPRKKMRNNLGGHDYIGSQDITLQQTANHSSHMQNDGMYDQLESKNTIVHGYESTQINNIQQKYTSVGAANGFVNKEGVQTPTYAVRRDKTFADNHMSNGDEYAIDEPTAETSFNETIDNRTGTADSYIVLDPNDTGFNRTTLSNTPTCYGFVKPVRDTRNKIGDDDQYAISDEGVYDYSGSNRQKELENNIYNHAVDTIYDSGSHKRRNEGREDTYDHFFGQKTEDDYDVSTTT
ncbi:unnamed protein product [Mytilus coruscus]|uniref:MAM domain-containing protein n=1 Tax=Mytilus coruscus TaxID=42192 RepID=A0A6J8CU23_MYTCO|nr:unnamed protein product [Mytilus coruscus]